jgi:hypothetical protein
MINKISLFIFCVVLSLEVYGQENIDSPNTVFGIGDIQLFEGGRSAGMSSASMSLSGSYFLNTINPAALSNIDTTNLIFDMILSGRVSEYSYRNSSEKAFSANFTRIAAGLRFSKRLAGAISFKPYSTVSYHIDKYLSKEGTDSKIKAEYEGSGGINQFSVLSSYKFSDKLSGGTDLMVLFGTIEKTINIEGITVTKEGNTRAFAFSAGMLYKEKLADNLDLSAALIYGSVNNFKFSNNVKILDIEGISIFDKNSGTTNFMIPCNIGAGLSLRGKRFLVSTDYYFRNKLTAEDDNSSVKFANTSRLNCGLAITPPKYSTNYFEAIEYQTGFSVSNSYLVQNGINPKNIEFSAGAGFPLRGGSQVNLAFSWGRRGIQSSGIIREDYFRLSLGFSLVERMFVKRLYY